MAARLRGLIIGSVLFLACRASALPQLPFGRSPAPDTQSPDIAATLPSTDALAPISLHSGRGFRSPWYEIYFTDPANPVSDQFTGGVDDRIVDAIDNARISVDVAMYSLTLTDVRDALVRAHRRGIPVRMVMESDNMDGDVVQSLKDAGIQILGDRREGLMHNKFMVIDGAEVWTGSMNYTFSSTFTDNNNAIRILSRDIAADYEAEFNEMFLDDRFGPDLGRATPNPRVRVDGTPINVYFSPDDHVRAALLDLLNGASSSIYFLGYSFTSDQLGGALRNADKAGLTVAGVLDEGQATTNLGSELDGFRNAGLDLRLDGNAGLMHDKVMIIDESVVVTGSYNFTNSAETTNDENLLVIHDRVLASKFLEEFRRIYAQAQP